MPTPTEKGDRKAPAESPGFATSIAGMRTAPVEHVVKANTRKNMAKTPEAWKQFNQLSRNIRIVNRGVKGPMKGLPFCGAFDGTVWPDECDPDDESSWLQPGEMMDVPKEVAIHLVGNLWDPNLPDKRDIIHRYGDFEYQGVGIGQGTARGAPMVPIGPPRLPDLVCCEISTRGKQIGEWKYLYDLYMKGQPFGKDIASAVEKEAAAQPEIERVKEAVPA